MAILQRRVRASSHSKSAAAAEQGLDYQEVAKVAYELYLQRGCANGHDLEDWLRAEALVKQRKGNGRASSRRQ